MRVQRQAAPRNTKKTGKTLLWLVAPLALAGLLTLAGCGGDDLSPYERITVHPKSAYRDDELALLRLMTDDIQQLEKEKNYGRIYDHFTSHRFRRKTPRRQFLIMTNCVEQHLGDLTEFDRYNRGFERKQAREGYTYDHIVREVTRSEEGKLQEEFFYIFNGAEFRLDGIFWLTDNKRFPECIQEMMAPKAVPLPKPTEASEPATDGTPAKKEEKIVAPQKPTDEDSTPDKPPAEPEGSPQAPQEPVTPGTDD